MSFSSAKSHFSRAKQTTEGDEATGVSVTRTADDITTDINGDPGFSSGNANVVR